MFTPPTSTDSHSEHTALHTAIAAAPAALLRATLEKLVDADPAFQRALCRELSTHASASDASTSARPSGTRRAGWLGPGRARVCGRCGEIYDIDQRRKVGECVYHPGDLEDAIYEFSSSMGRRLEAVQMWTCCGEDRDSIGCVSGRHHSVRAAADDVAA